MTRSADNLAQIWDVALPVHVRTAFSYRAPSGLGIAPGMRVRVPFRNQHRVGLVLGPAAASAGAAKLREIDERLDDAPVLGARDLDLLRWTAAYYHHPVGEVVATALPSLTLGALEPAGRARVFAWRLSEAGHALESRALERAPRQRAAWQALLEQPAGLLVADLRERTGADAAVLRRMHALGWIEPLDHEPAAAATLTEPAPEPTADQAAALEALAKQPSGFGVSLLDGVTGSGKTEVFLRRAAQVIADGRQVLVLVPEIALTPQTERRFRSRLGDSIAVLHSGLTPARRGREWAAAAAGRVDIVLGTRSAVFTPMPRLGLVIVDEEHDGSYKQQDGLRYHARDVAVRRAQLTDVPIILGSATPSLESLHNAARGRYAHLRLGTRASGAERAPVRTIDSGRQRLESGLSNVLRAAVADTLARGEQALLFLNRRGWAPVLLCVECRWDARCRRCDARMIWHRASAELRCHHCGATESVPKRCPACGQDALRPVGAGTEAIEAHLAECFPDAPVTRVDRDRTASAAALAAAFDEIGQAGPRLIVGTQMLAKGHDLPRVTLVGIVNVDGGLYSVDYRAPERLAQLVVQVAGRAGRAELPGTVWLQTAFPNHPLLGPLLVHDYAGFAEAALAERAAAGLPPCGYQALIRAEATDRAAAHGFLTQARARATQTPDVELSGPVAAPMERRAGRYRAQLLVSAAQRAPLHRFLDDWLPVIEALRSARTVRWSVDVDPQDFD
ncbi:MAG: primosomal protein N' [Chromatiales bacterium]|nr:primosomal protein N' [Chromatiales bacterium]